MHSPVNIHRATSSLRLRDISLRPLTLPDLACQVFHNAAVTSTKDEHVTAQIDKLSLTTKKKEQAIACASKITELFDAKMSPTDRAAHHTRMQSLLVEWGVAPTTVAKAPDYAGTTPPIIGFHCCLCATVVVQSRMATLLLSQCMLQCLLPHISWLS